MKTKPVRALAGADVIFSQYAWVKATEPRRRVFVMLRDAGLSSPSSDALVKRSAALAPLSQDHHHALVIASALTRAGEGTAASSAMLFADYISEHEGRHFALEEALLLPALPPGQRAGTLADRVLADHRYLRDAARQFKEGRLHPSVEVVHSIGARLRAHVQLEERELFPYLERSLDADALAGIGSQLEAAALI